MVISFKRGGTIILVFLLPAILASIPGIFADERSVTRQLSGTKVLPGGHAEVTLVLRVVAGDRFFLIDEVIPAGWTVVNSGKFDTTESMHLKMINISAVNNTSYTYSISAPSSAGTYQFPGTYYIEGLSSMHAIEGAASIAVISTGGGDDGGGSSGGITGGITGWVGPVNKTCPDGIITYGCECQGVFKNSGYCCGNVFQTVPCEQEQGPLPVLDECDEGDSEQCGSNIGACSYGTRNCKNGVWSDCVGGIRPSPESYDGIDNDCDGKIDDGCSFLDIARCKNDSKQCLCTGDTAAPESGLEGSIPASVTPGAFNWLILVFIGGLLVCVIIIRAIIRAQKSKSRSGGSPQPGTLPPVPLPGE